jgi:DNA-binding LacI/PurR family transcriptional regulator
MEFDVTRTEFVQKQISQWLDAQIKEKVPGDRLPPIREIMREFNTAQRVVQAVIKDYVNSGKLVSRSGLGTVIADPNAVESEFWDGDLLVLHRSSESAIASNLLRELARRFSARGVSMLQIGYDDEEQALQVLERLGRYKACLIQGHFQPLSIEFLSSLKAHAAHIISDGVYVAGIDVDAVGTDWREAVSLAFSKLKELGHERIGFITSGHSARTIAMARREFEILRRFSDAPDLCPLIAIDALPGDYTADILCDALQPHTRKIAQGELTALITWGVVEGIVLDLALTRLGLRAGVDVSVIMLGSVDFQSEHLKRFDVVGNSDLEKIKKFEELIMSRIDGTGGQTQSYYLAIETLNNGSVIKN